MTGAILTDPAAIPDASELPSKAIWRTQPDQLKADALRVLSYLGRTAAEVGDDGYSVDWTRHFGWMIRRMIRALETAEKARAAPLEPVEFVLETCGYHPVDAINEARACITIILEHHFYSIADEWTPTEDENQGLALMLEMARLFLDEAEVKIPSMREANHAAQ